MSSEGGSGSERTVAHDSGDRRIVVRPRDINLTSQSFSGDLPDRPRHRCILNIEGAQRTGKDWLSLDAPDPVVVFNFDQGLEGVIEQFRRKGKRIVVAGMPGTGVAGKSFPHYHFSRPATKSTERRNDKLHLQRVREAATPIWETFVRDYTEFLHSKARTGVIDTGTAAFNLGRFAVVGTDKPNQEVDPYGKRGADFKSVFQGLVVQGYDHDKNVIWLHREKDEWSGGQTTGNKIADGYQQIRYEVQLTLRLTRKMRGKDTLIRTARVVDCRIDPSMDGEEFETEIVDGKAQKGGEFRFANIMAGVYGTDVEVWR